MRFSYILKQYIAFPSLHKYGIDNDDFRVELVEFGYNVEYRMFCSRFYQLQITVRFDSGMSWDMTSHYLNQ